MLFTIGLVRELREVKRSVPTPNRSLFSFEALSRLRLLGELAQVLFCSYARLPSHSPVFQRNHPIPLRELQKDREIVRIRKAILLGSSSTVPQENAACFRTL